MPASPPPQTFVLVHGAWHGGWCWSRVAQALRALGHTVYTPTQTGLGERGHLLGRLAIDLDTFVRDIENVLAWEDLHDVVLVGHSFGGLTITGVADRMPQRLRRLVYLDAFILGSGVSTFDTLPPALVEKLRASAQNACQGLGVPPPRPAALGLLREADAQFVGARLTPQPLGVYESALQLRHSIGNGLPCSYWHCTDPSFAALEGARLWARAQADWEWRELATGHDAMVSAPELVVKHLLDI